MNITSMFKQNIYPDVIALLNVKRGLPVLSPVEAAAISLESQGHAPGVSLLAERSS
jgi:hypothetical protein